MERKECIILQYYLQDYHDVNILHRCIDSIQKFNLDIILVSHSPIPESIQKKVKYCLYDGDDELVTFEDVYYGKTRLFTNKWYGTSSHLVNPFLFVVDDISYSFCKCVYDSYRLVVSLGYEYSYYFIGDFEIIESEIEELRKIPMMLKEENKLGYCEQTPEVSNCFFWYVNNKWYLENFFINMNSKDEFFQGLNELGLYCHYDFLFDYMVKKNSDLMIIKKVDRYGHSFVPEERSDLSKKKSSEGYDYDIGIFYLDNNPYIFCFDKNEIKHNWDVLIEYNDGGISKYNVQVNQGNGWTMFPVEIKQEQFRIKVFDTSNYKLKYNIYIDDLNRYKEYFKMKPHL